jgi:hypothetical protein
MWRTVISALSIGVFYKTFLRRGGVQGKEIPRRPPEDTMLRTGGENKFSPVICQNLNWVPIENGSSCLNRNYMERFNVLEHQDYAPTLEMTRAD